MAMRPIGPVEESGMFAVDHLVYAVPDLAAAVAEIEAKFGIRPTPGGSHPGLGTCNALLGLGPTSYLEIVGPDPAQHDFRRPRVFQIDELETPRLVTWAAKGTDIDKLAAIDLGDGDCLGEPGSGSRQRPDGVLLEWRLTNPFRRVADGVVPFFINWGDSVHPASDAAAGATLLGLRAQHPDHATVRRKLALLGLAMPVSGGDEAALIGIIDTPGGRIELR